MSNHISKTHRTRHKFRKQKIYPFDELLNTRLDIDKDTNTLSNKGLYQLYSGLYHFRNKYYETFRYIITNKQGDIVDHIAVSNKHVAKTKALLPNKNSASDSLSDNAFWHMMREYLYTNNYNLVIAHNHPSGRIEPSMNDTALTARMQLNLAQMQHNPFLGHIIFDHGKFSMFERASQNWYINTIKRDFEQPDPLLKKKKDPFADISIFDTQDFKLLCTIAKQIDKKEQWNTKDFVPFFFTNSMLQIQGINFIKKDELYKLKKGIFSVNAFEKKLMHHAKQFSAQAYAPILSTKDTKLTEAILELSKRKLFIDAYLGKETLADISENVGYFISDKISSKKIFFKTTPAFHSFAKKKNLAQKADFKYER